MLKKLIEAIQLIESSVTCVHCQKKLWEKGEGYYTTDKKKGCEA